MNQTHLISRKRVTTLTGRTSGFFLLLLLSGNVFAGSGDALDDGWRRTKDGWEHISQWHLTAEQRELPSDVPLAPAVLWPSAEQLLIAAHPLVVALGIAVLGGIALHSNRFAAASAQHELQSTLTAA